MLELTNSEPIAYFCAEYGFDTKLPLYAGGLGVLAGDTIKAAADINIPFVGVGLLYRGERAISQIDSTGMQIDKDYDFDPLSAGLEHVYFEDQPLFVRVHLTEIDVWARVWKKTFSSNVVLYLLDTNTDQNQASERSINRALYSGSEEFLLKQQFILGIGGVKLLHTLGIHPRIFHLNEGRPAFLHWQLIRHIMSEHGLTFEQASELARSKTVYTNHTLVAAGNNYVPIDMLRRFAKYYAQRMNVSLEVLLAAGMEENISDSFSMTRFALNISKEANGVSELHTKLSAQNWSEHHWTNVTNGVHMPTWQRADFRDDAVVNDDAELWHFHLQAKKELREFVQTQTGFGYDENKLVVTWARRLAGYKRVDAIFSDVERLRSILKNADRPVQLLIAGKAHIQDTLGKQLLQQIIHYMSKELAGCALYIPNYNLDVARYLVQGSDLWLNIPKLGEEACGTSGMKAISNGVIQCTVPDGWAAEVNWLDVGWPLNSDDVAIDFYNKLSTDIAPLYYTRNEQDIPTSWLKMMRNSIELSRKFSAARMLEEYQQKLYNL